jgi:hypothetical protein
MTMSEMAVRTGERLSLLVFMVFFSVWPILYHGVTPTPGKSQSET